MLLHGKQVCIHQNICTVCASDCVFFKEPCAGSLHVYILFGVFSCVFNAKVVQFNIEGQSLLHWSWAENVINGLQSVISAEYVLQLVYLGSTTES